MRYLPVLSERGEVGDLQRVSVGLIVLLIHNSPGPLPSILLDHLLTREALCLCCVPGLAAPSHTALTHTCPSTIHRDIAVLPSGPGRNRSVAVRGLMLEMTKLDGAPGSSTWTKDRESFFTQTFFGAILIKHKSHICFLHVLAGKYSKTPADTKMHNVLTVSLFVNRQIT